jgi:hypothetical protein
VGRLRRALHAAPARGPSWTSPTTRAASWPPWWPRAPRRARCSRPSRDSLRGQPPDVVVLEDLHWADEATLDVLRLLARRIESLPALVLATYRDDEIDPATRCGSSWASCPAARRRGWRWRRCRPTGVAELAGSLGVDHAELYRRTAGNPFYVTEVLAAAGR